MKRVISFFYTIYLFVGATIYVFVYGGIVLMIGGLLRLFSKNLSKKFVVKQIETFGRMAFKLLGIKVYKFGEISKTDNNFLIVSNHQSALDIPLVIGYVTPAAFIAKKELAKVPGINWYLKYLNSVLIDRGNIRQTAAALKEVVKRLRRGVHFIIFPEGTRSEDGKVLSFKPRSLELAFKYKVKVLPVSIWGLHRVWKKKRFLIERHPVYIKIHDFIDPKDFNSEEELRIHVENVIKEGVEFLERRHYSEES
ncbi:lysophospholipid acyltransferase family protein [Thermosipho atlanticus]|uniref:1-acyl-sn-glycerol-3-phosphate acyltransferase n=1 Tax=Thermosipho atlanticus DSM 15807 TaxID=1123380 RepID=A0A1M5S0T0_9BACT|nr:lysophospholipid acyltransferase family protein [Thermosipho atlanticus]SHH32035.1 1-acyl-sn-glycerol-3-phosphate acyltransferase [Thermosipho atlanticus DSM 15807]